MDPNCPLLTVVVAARDEAPAIGAVIAEILETAAIELPSLEVVVVDDGSRDETRRVAESAARAGRKTGTRIRVVSWRDSRGQTAAFAAGIDAADGRWIATFDGDGQNDPSDLVRFLSIAIDANAGLVQGTRVNRCDGLRRKFASGVGRIARRVLLGDHVRDTGCSARVMPADIARALPLDRPGMHRFIPAFVNATGSIVIECPASHRPRIAGRSKYGMASRGGRGLVDCVRVRRLIRAEATRREARTPAQSPAAIPGRFHT